MSRTPRSTIPSTAGMLAAALAALAGCTSSPTEPATSEPLPLYQAPNGDVGLVFLDTSEQRSQGEWDACHGKAACAPGESVVGLSAIPGSANRSALCRRLGGQFTASSTGSINLDGNRDVRRAARLPDWAPEYYKLECGANEYVLGVSEDAAQCQGNRNFHAVLCGAASGLTSACHTRTFDARDDRGTTASQDWDFGAFKGECGPGQYVAGVSVDPGSRRAHSLLCCNVSPGNPFVTVSGRQFMLDGAPFHHTSANVQGLIFETIAQARTDLAGLAADGVREARILIANTNLDTASILSRLQAVVDAARPLGIRLTVVLTGNYGGHFAIWTPPGDPEVNQPYKTGGVYQAGDDAFLLPPDGSGLRLFSDAWLAGGYRTNYLPFVDAVVTRFRNEPTIMAWDLAGEVKSPTFTIANVISFHRDVARHVKALDPNHLITPGIISTRQVGMSNVADQDALLGDGAIDYISAHSYEDGEDDAAVAQRLGKPYVIAEFGFSMPGGDKAAYRARVDAYFQKVYLSEGAQAAGFWGIEYGTPHGLGDTTYTSGRLDVISSLWHAWLGKI
jgi:hypothetical protein